MSCHCGRRRPEREFEAELLKVEVYNNRAEMGAAAARGVAARMRQVIAVKGKVAMVFAAAPSQNEFLAALAATEGLDWQKVVAFHLDEYVGLPPDAPQGFGNFLRRHLFDAVKPGVVHFMAGYGAYPEAEARRYSDLLGGTALDIACIGIGENGHLAFNDPPVADFQDPLKVKIVDLESRCREQQVHDGCFNDLAQVPERALTMTIPAIVSAASIHCMVPGPTKAQAVRDTVSAPIATAYPASILRRYADAILYLDQESAALL